MPFTGTSRLRCARFRPRPGRIRERSARTRSTRFRTRHSRPARIPSSRPPVRRGRLRPLGTSFLGLGNGFSGPAGTMSVDSVPPDTNGAVGPNHYVADRQHELRGLQQDRHRRCTGRSRPTRSGPASAAAARRNNDGDATVAYDRLADRWVISQFSVSTTPYLECVAVSTDRRPDRLLLPLRVLSYATTFPDYPKLGVWPDAYYVTLQPVRQRQQLRRAPRSAPSTARRCSTGQAATQQCFTARRTSYGGLLPSDLDGATPPPAGAPNYVARASARTRSHLWKFHVDWATPGELDAVTGPTTHPGRRPSRPPAPRRHVRPAAGTSQKLDSLGDRLMYRLAYRNFGDHESLVVDHTVTAGSSVGMRWYELRDPGGDADRLPAGHVRARLDLPLDGQRRDGPERRHRARLQRLQLEHAARASATPAGSPATRSAR